MIHKGSAIWHGSLQKGSGTVSTESGVLQDSPYSFKTRFGDDKGTNPEELIGAAHAGCYSMAFSLFLGEAGFEPESIKTTADVHLDKDGAGFAIKTIVLKTSASIPNITEEKFQELAEAAKANCPVSKLFNAKIEFTAELIH